jgi:hypothetical protein
MRGKYLGHMAAPEMELRTLGDVLDWARARGLTPPSVVTQDEYTHDVVLATGGGNWLVFDTT